MEDLPETFSVSVKSDTCLTCELDDGIRNIRNASPSKKLMHLWRVVTKFFILTLAFTTPRKMRKNAC